MHALAQAGNLQPKWLEGNGALANAARQNLLQAYALKRSQGTIPKSSDLARTGSPALSHK